MKSEFFARLRESSRAMGESLKRKPPIETDIVDLVTNIDEYRGKKVTVMGDAEFDDEKIISNFSSGMTMHPITVSETVTYHRIRPSGIAKADVSILFEERIGNTAGEAPEKGDVYEGKVAVTGRVRMEPVKEKDELIGKVKALRPYIKAEKVDEL